MLQVSAIRYPWDNLYSAKQAYLKSNMGSEGAPIESYHCRHDFKIMCDSTTTTATAAAANYNRCCLYFWHTSE